MYPRIAGANMLILNKMVMNWFKERRNMQASTKELNIVCLPAIQR